MKSPVRADRRRLLKAFLSGVLVCFALAAGGTSYLVLQQTEAARRLARYDIAWDAGQGVTELLRFEATAGRDSLDLQGGSEALLQLRYAILQNRVVVLNRPEFAGFINSHPEVAGVLPNLTADVQKIAPLVANPKQPGAIDAILTTLRPVEAGLVELSSLSANNVQDNVNVSEDQLQYLHFISTGVTGVLIVVGLVLIVILLRDNRVMGENNQRLRRLTNDLQTAGSQLSIAHDAVTKANDELNAQNTILISRDRDLAVQNRRFDAALTNMSQGLLMADGLSRVIVSNNRFLELFGLKSADVVSGRSVDDLFSLLTDRELVSSELSAQLHDGLLGLIGKTERVAFLAESGERAIRVGHKPMADGGWVATFEDVTEQRRADAFTEHLAHHDTLTDLPNRLTFGLSLEMAFDGRTSGSFFSLLLLDLDNFKDINDTLGHLAGDTLLVAVAERLRRCIGAGDSVARLGGDEFAIIQAKPRNVGETEELAHRIIATIAEPFHFEGQRVAANVSIGIALCTDSSSANAESLFRNADMALYRAKAEGRNTWRFFAPEMEEVVRERTAIASDIRTALDRQELELVYQPIFAFETGCLRQFEALIRWRHPTLGYVTPDRFIPVAEETRLILPIGEWVIGEACRTAKNWPEDVRIAVNLSPIQFRSLDLPRVVEAALSRSGLSPKRFELEVTESALLQDGDGVRAMLRELRALGVTVALDDFGTGYASLGYLQQFPFDKIKIDRSFVSQIVTRADSLAIVQSIIRLAAKLGMTTTAEGIETKEQLDILRSCGCDLAQGYLFDRPQPFATVQRKIAQGVYGSVAQTHIAI